MIAEKLDDNSTAGLMLIENLWAKKTMQAMVDANGRLVMFERIPHDVVEEALADIEALAASRRRNRHPPRSKRSGCRSTIDTQEDHMMRRRRPLVRAAGVWPPRPSWPGPRALSIITNSRSTRSRTLRATGSRCSAQQQLTPQRQTAGRVRAGAAAAAPAPAPVPAAAAPDLTAQLQQLAQLHDAGVLDDAEFAAAKQKLLAG